MTFRAKALAFSLSIGVLATVLAVVVSLSIHLIVRDDDRLNRVVRLGSDIRNAETLASEILLGRGDRARQQWKLLAENLRKDLRGLIDLPFATQGLVDELASRVASMDRAFTRLSMLPEDGDPLARNILGSRIQADKGALVSRVSAIEAEVRATQSANYRLAAVASLAVIGCLLLLALAHHLIMRRFLSGAWNDLTGAIGQIESGQLSVPIITTRRDEFGKMLQSLDAMRERLHTKIKIEDAARREAEELSQIKSRFIASVSHELRTPLMGLLGLIELAVRRRSLAEIQQDLSGAQTAGQHLLDLINQILDFSKIEANKLEIAAEPFQPDTTLKVAESIFAVQAAEKGVELELVSPAQESPRLIGDQHRLSQVLFNLVGNAVKFTDSGKVTISYDVKPAAPGSWRLRVDIVDTGPGIPESARDQIFKDFFQVPTQNVRAKVGTGLGLAISARVIELMGGQIGIVPDSGAGAHFFICVDLPEAMPQDEKAVEIEAPIRPSRSLRILLAEDVEINRMIVREILSADGHQVDEVKNGAECLERLRSDGPYDVILMDINMPVLDGIQATRAIRSSDAPWNVIPIVGLTANAFEQQVQDYMREGMSGCISKPVKWTDLLSILAVVTGTDQNQPSVRASGQGPDSQAPNGQQPAVPGATPLPNEGRVSEIPQPTRSPD